MAVLLLGEAPSDSERERLPGATLFQSVPVCLIRCAHSPRSALLVTRGLVTSSRKRPHNGSGSGGQQGTPIDPRLVAVAVALAQCPPSRQLLRAHPLAVIQVVHVAGEHRVPAAPSPSSTCHHRRSAGPRNSGLVAAVRCAVHQPTPRTKTSSPDSDSSVISRSSSVAGSPVAVILFMPRSSPVSVSSLLKNMAPCRIHTRCPSDDQLGRSVCAAGQPACTQVSRCIWLSGSDRMYPALTGRSGT